MLDSEIVIVSGLPRSGTSLMMQMLDQGGLEVVTDQVRTPDTDNPRGYYEFEIVKKIKQDTSWLPATRGKAFKLVSQLLYDLPASEQYRIVFMERDLDEVLASQEKMLIRLGRPVAAREEMKKLYMQHLERLHAWLRKQPNMAVLSVRYQDVIELPREAAGLVAEFLGGKADVEGMVRAVEPSLYHNRKARN